MTQSKSHRFYKEFPKGCRRDDFWGQVKRTVDGRPVNLEQVDASVMAISSSLNIATTDVVLDLCCGNGALTDRIFATCAGGVGVDFSEFLIQVARDYFEREPDRRYVFANAIAFVRSCADPARFTKALCYSAIQYMEDEQAVALLTALRQRFENVGRLFIGNIPDLDRIDLFAPPEKRLPGVETDMDTPIGIWRTTAGLRGLAARAGWMATISQMPSTYFAAHYRFDAILTRQF